MPAKSRSPQNKLCLSVRIVVPAHELLRSLTLRVLKDNAVLQKIAVDEQQLTAASNSTEDMTEEQRKERIQMAQFLLVFSPIQLEGACTLRVRVQTENSELRGVALKVDQAQLPADLGSSQSGL